MDASSARSSASSASSAPPSTWTAELGTAGRLLRSGVGRAAAGCAVAVSGTSSNSDSRFASSNSSNSRSSSSSSKPSSIGLEMASLISWWMPSSSCTSAMASSTPSTSTPALAELSAVPAARMPWKISMLTAAPSSAAICCSRLNLAPSIFSMSFSKSFFRFSAKMAPRLSLTFIFSRATFVCVWIFFCRCDSLRNTHRVSLITPHTASEWNAAKHQAQPRWTPKAKRTRKRKGTRKWPALRSLIKVREKPLTFCLTFPACHGS
mmetsp:Transcript_840/g.3493  ORF Transcript_840/g.3493 Transcript_840/m.3493 type:complete len:264 (+) Transcript_840:185-976(+)